MVITIPPPSDEAWRKNGNMADVEHAKSMLRVFGIEYDEIDFSETEIRFRVSTLNDSIDYNYCPMTAEEFCAYVRGIVDARTLFGIKE